MKNFCNGTANWINYRESPLAKWGLNYCPKSHRPVVCLEYLWDLIGVLTSYGESSTWGHCRAAPAEVLCDCTQRWCHNSQTQALWGEVRVRLGLGLTLSLTTSWHAAGCGAVRGIGGSRAGKAAAPSSPAAVCCSSLPNQAIICFISLMRRLVCEISFRSETANCRQIWINPGDF